MAYELPLHKVLRLAGWKIKIRDRERLEPPHVTIFFKMKKWRLCLRSKQFLETGDSWSQIDKRIKSAIEAQWPLLCRKWDEMYPENPVISNDDDEQDTEV